MDDSTSKNDSKSHLLDLYEEIGNIYFRTNIEGNLVALSPKAHLIFGYKDIKEMIGINVANELYFFKQDRINMMNQLSVNGEIKSSKLILKHKDGSEIFVETSARLVFDENKNIIGVEGVLRDTTKIILAEKNLKETLVNYYKIFNSSNDSIFILDMYSGKIVDANRRANQIFKYNFDEFRKLNFLELKSDGKTVSNYDFFIDKLKRAKEIGIQFFEWQMHSKNNDQYWVDISLLYTLISGKDRIVATVRDITERKEHEKNILFKMIEAEEKERERYAKELHDGVSPILSTVKLYSNALKDCRDSKMQTEITGKLENTIEEAIRTLSEISNNLSPHILQNFGLIEAIKSFVSKIKETIDIDITIKADFEGRLNEIIEVTFFRITIELINNTIKHSKAKEVLINFIKKENILYLQYRDNGIGFDIDKVQLENRGMGIFNIIKRVESLKGNINFLKNSNGADLNINIPLK